MIDCPKCGQNVEPRALGFTWWGGAIGPRLLSHVECPKCSARFNGKTGQSNEQAIRLYLAIVTVIALAVGYLLIANRAG
jgi:hypothetical protein